MSQQFRTVTTNAGRNAVREALAQGKTVKLSHMSVGDGGGSAVTPLSSMTALVNERFRAQINDIALDPATPDLFTAELFIPQAEGGFYIREVGLWTEDGTLFAVGNTPLTEKPDLSSGAATDLLVRLIIRVLDAAAVSIEIDPAQVLATRDYVDRKLDAHNKDGGAHETLARKNVQIKAGTGLSGGGTLEADREFAVEYGNTAGTACQGNDVRLSDSRTPKTHKDSHKTGGTDALTPADIDAAPASHTSVAATASVLGHVKLGKAAGTACEGNDSRLSDTRTPKAHKDSHKTGGADALAPGDIGAAPASHVSVAATTSVLGHVKLGKTAGTACEGNDARLADARTPKAHKDSHKTGGTDALLPEEIGAARGNRITATTPATAGWYRIAQSASGIANCMGLFEITGAVSGAHSVSLIAAGLSYAAAPGIIQLAHAPFSTPAITKARLVYHPTYSGNFAYLEVYLSQAKATPISINLIGGQGWTLVAPSTPGVVPSGYSTKELTLVAGKIAGDLQGTVSGNAGTATKLATARTISLSGDVTASGTFNGSANLALAAALAASGVTAGAYGPTAAATLAFGGSVNVPQITVDAKGRATTVVNRAIKLPAAPTSVTGNAGSATKLATARTISLKGDVTASGNFDGSANLALTAELKDSGVTAGGYGPTANATPAFGATFPVPQITVDAKGRVTTAVSRTVKIPANPAMTGATASAAGKAGLVPAPAAGAQGKCLRGDGTWGNPQYADSAGSLSNIKTTNQWANAVTAPAGGTWYYVNVNEDYLVGVGGPHAGGSTVGMGSYSRRTLWIPVA